MDGFVLFAPSLLRAQVAPPPPAPPAAPAFMTMKGLPLACFAKPAFEADGLEFFVCNGGAGLSGVRKKSDPARHILVREPDIAMNLNLQAARAECPNEKVGVSQNSSGEFGFRCQTKEVHDADRFHAISKAEWAKYTPYMYR